MEGKSNKSTNSSLVFNNYIVNNVNFKYNEKSSKESWQLTFEVHNETRYNNEKNRMQIRLSVNIFKGIVDAPFYMDVTITGDFRLNGEEDISKYEANAIAIMYPYLRAIVSTYTSSANINPLILPAINVNAMLENSKKKEKKN